MIYYFLGKPLFTKKLLPIKNMLDILMDMGRTARVLSGIVSGIVSSIMSGIVSGYNGRKPTSDSGRVLATNGLLHAPMLEILTK